MLRVDTYVFYRLNKHHKHPLNYEKCWNCVLMRKSEKPKEDWNNIAVTLFQNRHKLLGLFTEEDLRIRLQFFCVYIIFAVVSTVMTIVNVFTGWHLLMLSTLVFSFLNLINIILALASSVTEQITRSLFALEILCLFLFFVVVGEPEGFSAIWLVLLPGSGMLLYRMKYGILLSVIELFILIFLFWTDYGRSLILYEGYTQSFLLRFPLLYVATLAIGIFFEFIRQTTQRELSNTRKQFEYLSKHDALTGLYNRFGFYSEMQEITNTRTDGGYAFAILDLDHFKNVNDKYGHLNGDVVLKQTAETVSEIVADHGWVSRWGGEEFSVFFKEEAEAEALSQRILNAFQEVLYRFDGDCFHVTVSIGLVIISRGFSLSSSELVSAADNNLYNSKQTGRNRITTSRLPAAKTD